MAYELVKHDIWGSEAINEWIENYPVLKGKHIQYVMDRNGQVVIQGTVDKDGRLTPFNHY